MSDPLAAFNKGAQPPTSSTTYTIAGILTTVHGLAELPPDAHEVTVLWLLHPRLATAQFMSSLAAASITYWNANRVSLGQPRKGLLAVAFDQRNHGSREVTSLANGAWRDGNPRHAQDMFSSYQGTAHDVSLLITHLGSYLPPTTPPITQNLSLGISLGAHAAWLTLLHDPRIAAGVIIIGTPDYTRLMCQRAMKSRLSDWTQPASAPGSAFIPSPSFPASLAAALRIADPASLLLPPELQALSAPTQAHHIPPPDALVPFPAFEASQREALEHTIKGKAALVLSGGADKLVPPATGRVFIEYLKQAVDPKTGWWREGGFVLDERVYEGVGHEVTPRMAEEAVKWVGEYLAGRVGGQGRGSKI
ncbi:hypothetical protein EJ06DRAFT_511705 [Trichodelitschia bisporula]|uniref:Alpha/beta-hydrolase n=1 Tax=Trichodelitschia bisporula TaxID=703511 RepID=A0A6G1HU77_9PEZI|nr:hypothetical protein EJ06DRAFT_511705 [Trichodelitschia bisporula]